MSDRRGPADATASVTVRVAVAPAVAFDVFTREIDQWWRRGRQYRHTGDAGTLHIEPRVDGRVYERSTDGSLPREFELGRVRVWQPPDRLLFSWRNATFAPLEHTEVEVIFRAVAGATLVTVRHRGWEALRPDHPARHGMADDELARSVGTWWAAQLAALRERAAAR